MESIKNTKPISKPIEGVVKSIIDSRTIVVTLEEKIKHALYNKVIKRVKHILAHVADDFIKKDEKGNLVLDESIKEGAQVKLHASKPISKKKKWIIKK